MTNTVQHQKTQLKKFDWDLQITKDQIPDPQNLHFNEHAKVTIPKVGISNLQMPLIIKGRDGDSINVKGTIKAYVSLDSTTARGINMSRLARGLYNHVDNKGAVELMSLIEVVDYYRTELPAENGYLSVEFDYPYRQKHWREPHEGWLYYPVKFEIENVGGVVKTFITVTTTYNSACPCSKELSEFSQKVLNTPATPHSQRSLAIIKVQFDPSNIIWIEDLIDLFRRIQPSEVLSGIVTRVGELSMAQMVSSLDAIGFIEDLLRKFWEGLNNEPRILDFVVELEHQESLNQNYASGFINKRLAF